MGNDTRGLLVRKKGLASARIWQRSAAMGEHKFGLDSGQYAAEDQPRHGDAGFLGQPMIIDRVNSRRTALRYEPVGSEGEKLHFLNRSKQR
jgi:hypothetical protein